MTRSSIANIRQKLQESRQKTLQLIDSLPSEIAIYRPRFDAWSIKDHVAHLAVVEESVICFAHRILNEDCPISPLCHNDAFDQDAWNNREVVKRAGYTWTESLHALKIIRNDLLTLLDKIPTESLDRIGNHPIWGEPVTLASVLRVPYRHERGHRDEMAALCAHLNISDTLLDRSPSLEPDAS